MTAKGEKGARGDVDGVSPQGDGLDHVGAASDAAADDQRDVAADALVAQALVNARKRQLNGDAHVVPDAGGRGPRASAEAVDGDDIRAAAGDAAGDSRHVVHRGDLDDDRLLIADGLL